MKSPAVVEQTLKSLLPADLGEAILAEYRELHRRFSLADYRPSQLSGGRFGEAALRVCQQVVTGMHTPIGDSLDSEKSIKSLLTSVGDDSFRIHIPRAVRMILDLRNKRDVAHLGKGVSPNFTDSTLILGVANWIMSELVRIAHKCTIDEAQQLCDSLVQRRVPLIYDEDDLFRILKPEMSTKERVLLTLYHLSPSPLRDRELAAKIEYKNLSRFRSSILPEMHREALLDYRDATVTILPPGMKLVEAANYNHA